MSSHFIFQLKEKQKPEFRRPWGQVLRSKEDIINHLHKLQPGKIITVGDYVSDLLQDKADFLIVDGKIERKASNRAEKIKADLEITANNPQSKITKKAWRKVKEGLAHSLTTKLTIKGEEDLLGMPAILLAPLNSAVIYGLRNEGAVIVEVSQDKKEMVNSLLNWKTYDKVMIGGSWDHLHAGHKFILMTALAADQVVSVGITSQQMLEDKIASRGHDNENHLDPLPFSQRKKELKQFLDKYGSNYEIKQLNDFKGEADREGNAIVVSEETYDNAMRINDLRQKEGRNPLEIEQVKRIKAEDGRPISSSRIRQQEINREGLLT